jgi:hypothetical protein
MANYTLVEKRILEAVNGENTDGRCLFIILDFDRRFFLGADRLENIWQSMWNLLAIACLGRLERGRVTARPVFARPFFLAESDPAVLLT